jgi:ArsR family transcriptional regulator
MIHYMPDPSPSTTAFLRALANDRRLLILEWLLDPVSHFPKQVDGDLVRDGVCLGAIVRKMDVTQPTVTAYMQTLTEAGLVSSKRIKNWVFFKADRDAVARSVATLAGRLAVGPADGLPEEYGEPTAEHSTTT